MANPAEFINHHWSQTHSADPQANSPSFRRAILNETGSVIRHEEAVLNFEGINISAAGKEAFATYVMLGKISPAAMNIALDAYRERTQTADASLILEGPPQKSPLIQDNFGVRTMEDFFEIVAPGSSEYFDESFSYGSITSRLSKLLFPDLTLLQSLDKMVSLPEVKAIAALRQWGELYNLARDNLFSTMWHTHQLAVQQQIKYKELARGKKLKVTLPSGASAQLPLFFDYTPEAEALIKRVVEKILAGYYDLAKLIKKPSHTRELFEALEADIDSGTDFLQKRNVPVTAKQMFNTLRSAYHPGLDDVYQQVVTHHKSGQGRFLNNATTFDERGQRIVLFNGNEVFIRKTGLCPFRFEARSEMNRTEPGEPDFMPSSSEYNI